jgi:hypothetical protein
LGRVGSGIFSKKKAGRAMGGYTVITTMKNEGCFLLEWVAHHKALGFDHLLICTNDCVDPTRIMVRRLQAIGLAQHHATRPWAATSIQRSALKQALRHEIVQAAEWIYVCDADEFLVVKTGDGSARALVAAAGPEAEVIAVPWRVFGPNGRRDYSPGRITQQFTMAMQNAPSSAAYAKSLFRGLPNMHRIGIHGPIPRANLGRPLRREMPGGIAMPERVHQLAAPRDYSVAQINHYALRSRDSFLVKRDRGRVNHSNEVMGTEYWDRFNVQEVSCTAISRYEAAVEHWMAELMADPVLARLHREAVAWHEARILALRSDPGYAEVIAHSEERGE